MLLSIEACPHSPCGDDADDDDNSLHVGSFDSCDCDGDGLLKAQCSSTLQGLPGLSGQRPKVATFDCKYKLWPCTKVLNPQSSGKALLPW